MMSYLRTMVILVMTLGFQNKEIIWRGI